MAARAVTGSCLAGSGLGGFLASGSADEVRSFRPPPLACLMLVMPLLPLDACTRLRLQHGWSRSYAPRLAVQRWYLLMLLTGEHPVIAGAKKPFSWHCGNYRCSAPGPLRAFLHRQAEINPASSRRGRGAGGPGRGPCPAAALSRPSPVAPDGRSRFRRRL